MFLTRQLLAGLRGQFQFRKRSTHLGSAASILVISLLFCAFVFPVALSADGTNRSVAVRLSLSQPLTIRWRYASESTLNLTPASDNERIYLPLAGGTIVSLRASDGQLYWKSEIGGEFSASPSADQHAVYVASETLTTQSDSQGGKGSLRALGIEGGLTIWMKPLPAAVRGALAVGPDKVVAGAADGNVYAFDKASGNVLWLVQSGSAMNCQPVISGKAVYLGNENGMLLSLEEGTGKLRWRFQTSGPLRGPVAVANDLVFFGSGDGYVYAVSESEGHLRWRTRTGAGVQAVTKVADGLLVASLDNFAYLLSLNRGKRIWKRQLPGRVSAQPLTTDDSALFTPLSSSAGVVLALRDGKQVNSLPTGDSITTAASPVVVADAVFLTTDHGLLAFAHPAEAKPSPNKP
jgi:eukaryotic-like serine/threonine-protein kinase